MEQLIMGNRNIFSDYPDVMNVRQMCKALHISSATAYEVLRNGTIHSLKIGREYKIPKWSLIEYLDKSLC